MTTAVQEKEITSTTFEYSPANVQIGGGKVYLFVKRLLDLAISVLGMIALSLPMLIIAIFIKLDSEGPVIFKQERLGLNGKPFMIYKFRSMSIDAEINGPKWAEENDVRCTKFGAMLRKSRLDELPQLLNILRGDMSLVGPRPEREYFYIEFDWWSFPV